MRKRGDEEMGNRKRVIGFMGKSGEGERENGRSVL